MRPAIYEKCRKRYQKDMMIDVAEHPWTPAIPSRPVRGVVASSGGPAVR
jgi:hypothetical protein